MTKLIHTRRGAVTYALAPFVIAALLALMLLFGTVSPFAVIEDDLRAIVAGLMLLMAFSLAAYGILIRWGLTKLRQKKAGLASALLAIPIILLLWFPAVLGAIPLYVMNLVCLARGKYPRIPWQRSLWLPALLCVAVLVPVLAINQAAEQQTLNTPAPTAEEAFLKHSPEAGILAVIPDGEDAAIIVSYGASGRVVRGEEGWLLAEAYKTAYMDVESPRAIGDAYIGRSEMSTNEVVVLWKARLDLNPTGNADLPPRDSLDTEFAVYMEETAVGANYYYYALADVDTPGYTLYAE